MQEAQIRGWVCAVSGVFIAVASTYAQCDASFAPGINYGLSTASTGHLVVADFDGDGQDDFVATVPELDSLAVFLTRADGGPPHLRMQPLGFTPGAMAVADLNADGRPDLVVINPNDSAVASYLGGPEGDLAFVGQWDAGPSPVSVCAADFTGDGLPDIVVANYVIYSTTVSLLRSRTDGAYEERTTHHIGGTPRSLLIGDRNGDGYPDVVALLVDGFQDFAVLYGSAPGSGSPFQSLSFAVAGSFPWRFTLGDLNRDGRSDLVVCHSLSRIAVASQDFQLTGSAGSAAVGDLNRDGLDDVIVSTGTASVSILYGLENGLVAPPVVLPLAAGGSGEATLGDFDGDGRVDLLARGQSGYLVSVHLSTTGLEITEQPQRASIQAGASAAFRCITASGDGVGYHWLLDDHVLVDGLMEEMIVSGSSTDTLHLLAVGRERNGSAIACRLTTECGPVQSWIAVLSVDCLADTNGDGSLSVLDIFEFLAAWFSGDVVLANFNGDCCINVGDIFDFLTAWFAGCP